MLSFWVIRNHWMGKASCFLGHRSGVMILTMDAGKSFFIKFVWGFFSGKSLLPLPSLAERKISVNWEAELLNKRMLNPDCTLCALHCVLPWCYFLTVIHWSTYPLLQSKTLVSKECLLICGSVFTGTEPVAWEVHDVSLSLMTELIVSGRYLLDLRLAVKG